MKRLTKTQSKIIRDHIDAKLNNNFSIKKGQYVKIVDLKQLLTSGQTIESLYDEIQFRFCSVTSMLLGSMFNHVSQNYKKDITKGFKIIFEQLNIQ